MIPANQPVPRPSSAGPRALVIAARTSMGLQWRGGGRRIMVIPKLPKLEPWVRFPSPAPTLPPMLANAGQEVVSPNGTAI
jgi:hypothetical protein